MNPTDPTTGHALLAWSDVVDDVDWHELQALYERLLAKYVVRIDSPGPQPAASEPRGAP